MKLTKLHKQAIVQAIMDDVPSCKRDFNEEFRKLVVADMIEQAQKISPHLVALLKDPSLRSFACSGYDTALPESYRDDSGNYRRAWDAGISSVKVYNGYQCSPAVFAKAKELMDDGILEKDRLTALRTKVEGAVNACTTRKQIMERMPEFEKYLPEEVKSGSDRNLPAIANLAADLIKAGWPKSEPRLVAA